MLKRKERNSLLKAFTLAEVLITLGIIGVVAAMTIPTLISNYQKTQYVTALKKAYAQGNQALKQMTMDSSGDLSSFFGSTDTVAGSAIAAQYKVLRNCGTTAGEECFARFDNYYDGSSGSTSDWASYANPKYKFVTADGMSYAVTSYGDSCTYNWGSASAPDSPVYNSTCGYVYIDVNGLDEPNNLGRDVFLYLITNKKNPLLYPFTGSYTGTTWSAATGGSGSWNYSNANRCYPTTTKVGRYCLPRIMEKGWVMDY